jgi:hypothetical protein
MVEARLFRPFVRSGDCGSSSRESSDCGSVREVEEEAGEEDSEYMGSVAVVAELAGETWCCKEDMDRCRVFSGSSGIGSEG